MAAAQQNGSISYSNIRTHSQDVQFGPTDATLLCDVSTGQPRPIVPAAFRRTVSDAIHGLFHPSIRTTQKLLTDRYVWHGTVVFASLRISVFLCFRTRVHVL